MNLRNFVVLGIAFAGIGGTFSYGVSGCSPKTIVDDDGGNTKTCMETGAGPGEGCPCPAGYKPKACYEGPTGTLGPGRACKSGTRKCGADGLLTACEGQMLPGEEVCNGLDDDCDGRIDNLITMDPILSDLSEAGLDPPIEAGVQCYVNGAVGLCAAGYYGCNKQNQKDCVPLVTVDPDGGMSPYTEVCNTLDDDCNGTVDDVDYQGQMCMVTFDDGGSPKGECAKGTRSCVNGLDSCVGPKPMADNNCDGKDNTCNGQYDEQGCGCPCSQGQYCCVYMNNVYCFSQNIGNPYTCYQKP